jgi:hypothetical protein
MCQTASSDDTLKETSAQKERERTMLSFTKKNEWKSKVIRLACRYGPFVRFTPEGNEDNLTDEEKEAAKKAEFDKERQKVDQAESVARKAKADLAATQTSLDAERQNAAELKQRLADAEAKASAAGIAKVPDLKESDFEGSDVEIVKTVNALKEQVAQKDKDIAALNKIADDFREDARKEQARRNSDAAFEELLSDLDTEYGADVRNDALERWEALREEGKIPKGKPAMATRLMTKCYREAKVAAEKAKKEKDEADTNVRLDSGSGGGQPGNLSGAKLKPGQSLDEAVKQLKTTAS